MKFHSIFFTFILAVYATNVQHEANYLYQDQWNFKPCIDNLSYPINLTDILFEPYPIVIGEKLDVKLTGTCSTTIIQGAFASLSLFYNGNLISSNQFDLCSFVGINCPIAPGNFGLDANSVPLIRSVRLLNSTISLITKFTGKSKLYFIIILY